MLMAFILYISLDQLEPLISFWYHLEHVFILNAISLKLAYIHEHFTCSLHFPRGSQLLTLESLDGCMCQQGGESLTHTMLFLHGSLKGGEIPHKREIFNKGDTHTCFSCMVKRENF